MTAPGPPDAIEVLIPHHARAASLRRTLQSLRAQTQPARVCVVDNDSNDESRAMLAAEFPEVRVLALDRNYGFGAALNRGVATCSAEQVAFLNNDAVADPGFVEQLAAEQRRSNAEMVAGCLRSPGGAVESMGVTVDRSLTGYDLGFGLADPERYAGPPPLGPSGGAALYSRQAFEEAGGFDERIFAYLEDVDLALRMRLTGMSCALAPGAVAWHEHSATLGARSAAKNELLGYARRYLLWKYGRSLGLRRRARAGLIDLVVYAGKAVVDRDLGAVRGSRRARRELRGRDRPGPRPGFDDLPLLDIGTGEALRRRLARRR